MMDAVSVNANDFLKAVQKPSGPRTSETVISSIDFDCPKCHQKVKGNRGYLVEHNVSFTNRYGLPETRLCNGSNNKIKAELRTLNLHGECGNCGTEFDYKLTEEYPGGLKQEGGVLEVPCIVCHGKTTATCEHCGGALTKGEGENAAWTHDMTGKNECPFAGVQDDSLDDDLDDEFFEAAPKGPQAASPLAGTEKTAELHMVLVDDGHEIPEYDDTPTTTSTENSEDALAQDQEV
jgi:hypothetical protein